MDLDFHGISPERRDGPGRSAPIEIGNRFWLGVEAVVLKGGMIGDDANVGARAVVTKDVPAGVVFVGSQGGCMGSVYAKHR